MKHELFFMT